MDRKPSDWYIPADIGCLLFAFFAFPLIAITAGFLTPLIAQLRSADVSGVFYIALSLGLLGSVLLFLARLPLYRQRRFFSFGPGSLSGVHRILYWVAYAFVAAGLLLLAVVWARVA